MQIMATKIPKSIIFALTIAFVLFVAILVLSVVLNRYIKQIENYFYIEENKNTILRIDLPEFESKKLQKKINYDVNLQKKEFLEELYALPAISDDKKYEFSTAYSVNKLSHINSIHITVYRAGIDDEYSRYDLTYQFNNRTQKFVKINYFLKNSNAIFTLRELTKGKLQKYATVNSLKFDAEKIDYELRDLLAFDNFYFSDDGLNIILDSADFFNEETGSLYVFLPFSDLDSVLKKNYILKEIEPVSSSPKLRDINEFLGKKLIAFTFDDGPSCKTTSALLDGLDKYQARVTFFVLGSKVEANKEVVTRAYNMGNQIGNHSYAHANLPKLKNNMIIKEIEDTNDIIERTIGVRPTLLRPPYGNANKKIYGMTDMNFILWDIDPCDWKYPDAEAIKNNILANAHDGAIVLLHDVYDTTIEGAFLAMEELSKQGYAFVTINEMAQLKEISLEKHKPIYNFN